MSEDTVTATTGNPSELPDVEHWLHAYEQMVKIRHFEEKVNELYTKAIMPGLAHLYIGEEAVAVGVCEALKRDDYITSTHRGHGHCLAKGASPDRMFAELLGKEAGYCRGKGGSMHIADQVAACFFGEGALGQGLLYEEMNLAQLWKLPIIYVCENNLYNEYTYYSETTAGDVAARAGWRKSRWGSISSSCRCCSPCKKRASPSWMGSS